MSCPMVIKLGALAIQHRNILLCKKERVLEEEYALLLCKRDELTEVSAAPYGLQVRNQGQWHDPLCHCLPEQVTVILQRHG